MTLIAVAFPSRFKLLLSEGLHCPSSLVQDHYWLCTCRRLLLTKQQVQSDYTFFVIVSKHHIHNLARHSNTVVEHFIHSLTGTLHQSCLLQYLAHQFTARNAVHCQNVVHIHSGRKTTSIGNGYTIGILLDDNIALNQH